MDTEPLPTPSAVAGPRPGRRWRTVSRGLHRPADPPSTIPPDDPAALDAAARARLAGDLRAWAQLLRPTACFTHLTSAAVRGWWLPPLSDDLPVWVVQISSQNAAQRAGLVVVRRRVVPTSQVVGGVRLASPAETIAACAVDLSLVDLVVLVDSALQAGDVTLAELQAVAAEHRRGAPNLRRALLHADGRSESPFETLLRLLHRACGIEVEPQREFHHDGSFVARGDLWVVGTTSVHEVDGVDHLDRRRQQQDLRRDRRFAAAGLTRRGYTPSDVLLRASTILRDAHAAVGRTHDPARIRAWHDLLRDSLFTPAGQERLRKRLGLEKTDGVGA